MSSSKPALPTHLISDTDIPLDDWLNLVRIVRERRDRVFGADLFHDPAMSILVLLGREASKGGGCRSRSLLALQGYRQRQPADGC